jgi:glycosyltransferase involved in cell wall biosynthesis
MSKAERGRIALLYDCTYPHIAGGGQKRLFEVFRRLVARGWEVDWYGLKAWEGDHQEVVEGIRFIPVGPATPLYRPDGKRSIKQTFYFGAAIAKWPKIGRYDIVHMGQWPYFHFFPARLFSILGGGRISADWWEAWGVHWLEYFGTKGYLGMALERLCARIPSKLVAISETGAKQLAGIGAKTARISIIHNGIDCEGIARATKATEGSDLIYLGRLQPHKNVDLLLRALAILKRRGQLFRLSIIGDGPEREPLAELAKQLNIDTQVRWLGSIDSDSDVYSHLKSAKVFVHPSTKEGGGSITSLEANAAGLPVVAFACTNGLSPELIADGVNGCWVPSVNAEQLSVGITRALELSSQPGCRTTCTRFAGMFDWDVITDAYENLFRSILGSGTAVF